MLSREAVKVKCKFCHKSLYKERRCFKENLKLGHNFYCSRICQYKFRTKKILLVCERPNCNKKFFRAPKDISAHNYCSSSCAITINNQKYPKRLPLKRFCVECSGEFKSRHSKYCSSKCGYKHRKTHGSKYTQAQVVSLIQEYHRKNNRVPAKRELKDISDKCANMFGSWNKAIEAAGLTPNRSHDHRMYKRTKTKAADGHLCDSVSEAIIDNWLTENKITHERNVHYPTSKHLADWKVNKNIFVEYFGLAKDSPRYDRSILEKKKLCKKNKIKLVAIYPEDLYPKIRLKNKFYI